MLLSHIGEIAGNSLVLKGGTLLNKMYLNYYRMSEDLDFSYAGKEDIDSRGKRSKAMAPLKKEMADFLVGLGMRLEQQESRGFNNSTQYVFVALYDSVFIGKNEKIKIEISLRARVYDTPVLMEVKHFYKDIFTGEDLIPGGKVLSLSYNEAVAEKLKASITRQNPAIRDFYDLKHIYDAGFDFGNDSFIRLFQIKLSDEKYSGNYTVNFGMDDGEIELLRKQIEVDLKPVIRNEEDFNLDAVFKTFNPILSGLTK